MALDRIHREAFAAWLNSLGPAEVGEVLLLTEVRTLFERLSPDTAQRLSAAILAAKTELESIARLRGLRPRL